MTKLKLFADNKKKRNVAEMTISLFDRAENTVGKGEQEGHDGPGVAHLSLLTKHNQFPTSCEIYVLPNNKILNSSV